MFRKFEVFPKLLLSIITFLLFCLPFNAVAEDVDAEFETVEDAGGPSEDEEVEDIMQKFLEKKRLAGRSKYKLKRL